MRVRSYCDYLLQLVLILGALGMYKGGAFVFSFVINNNYPHEPPKVKCTQKVRVYMRVS